MNFNYKKISVAVSLTSLNLIIASLVSFFKLPIYLDTLGILLSTILLGWQYGVLVSGLSALIGFLLLSPYIPFYILTMLSVVLFTTLFRKYNFFSNPLKVIVVGIVLGFVGTCLSAPITFFLFSGQTLSGNDIVVAYLIGMGKSILDAVILSAIPFDIIDRILVAYSSFLVLKAIPKSFVEKNDFNFYKDEENRIKKS